ncbi:MAG TPA: transglycosylase domain-containing protein, partial [Thermosynechococcaceae cyanobacterium]
TTNRTHTELKGLKDYSSYLPLAVLASEDSRFYSHLGIDPIGIARAVVTNVKGGEIREGASTVTQQLARSVFRSYVGSEDSAGRKLREAIVALKLEFDYSKDFLLLTYLNRVYMGYGNFGFEDSAQFYFGKSARDLSLGEAATLAGILPAPNSYNPVQNYDKAIEQRNGVLDRMTELGMISADEANKARRSRIEVNPKAKEELSKLIAPYYYSHVFNELQELLGERLAAEGNFIVQTALDIPTQAKAEASLRDAVESTGANAGFTQGAIVTVDSKNGEVVALVGGVDYKKSQFNRATAYRQPGSTFKMFAYTTALEQGFSSGATFSCAPLNWGGQYYEGCRAGGGGMTIATGLALSENVIALRVAQEAGLDKVVSAARRMGVRSKLNSVPGLVLGQSEVTPLEMAGAFNVLANHGVRNPPRAIRRIYDGGECKDPNNYTTCRLMYSNDKDAERNQVVVQPAIADRMTVLLQGVVQGGTGRPAAIGRGEAGKTGTTNNNVDLWFIGYIPDGLTTAIWLGNDNNSPTGGSSAVAADLWRTYMGQVAR